MSNRRSVWSWSLLALLAISFFSTGCVTGGRRVLLREYGPSLPASSGVTLSGVTICLRDFVCATNLVSPDPQSKPAEFTTYEYVNLTTEQDRRWNGEMKALQKQPAPAGERQIGNMRNAFGMVMSHVYALNDPAAWIAEGLKFDLESQGAKVVAADQASQADVTISGTVQLCRADMYMMINGTLVVDLVVQPRQGPARQSSLHTQGSTLAVLASEGEYFHALRECRQKFSILASREIMQTLKPAP